MMAKFTIGDVFECQLGGKNAYFQYVGNDPYQLNSDVIAAFSDRTIHPPAPEDISGYQVEFFAHVSLALGVKMKSWKRIFHTNSRDWHDVLFRDTNDYGNPNISESNKWWVWGKNKKPIEIGPLTGDYRKSYIGVVKPPAEILERLRTGHYSHFYPRPQGQGEYLS